MKLYELSAIYASIQQEIEEGDPDAQDRALAKIDAVEEAFDQKAQQVGFVVRNMEALAEAIGAEAEAMTARRKAIENRIASVKEYLRFNMERTSTKSIECPQFRITLRDNPPKVNVLDPKAVPADYLRQPETPPPEIDKRKILDDWKKDGVCVEGTEIVRGNRVEIR